MNKIEKIEKNKILAIGLLILVAFAMLELPVHVHAQQTSGQTKAPPKVSAPNINTGSPGPSEQTVQTQSTYFKRWLSTDNNFQSLYNYDDHIIFDTWLNFSSASSVTVQFSSEALGLPYSSCNVDPIYCVPLTYVQARIDGILMPPGSVYFDGVYGWKSNSFTFVYGWVSSGWHHIQLHTQGDNGNQLGYKSMIVQASN